MKNNKQPTKTCSTPLCELFVLSNLLVRTNTSIVALLLQKGLFCFKFESLIKWDQTYSTELPQNTLFQIQALKPQKSVNRASHPQPLKTAKPQHC